MHTTKVKVAVHYEITAGAIKNARNELPGEDVCWYGDRKLKTQITTLKDENGIYLFCISSERKFVRECPDCEQDVYGIIDHETLLGAPILWVHTEDPTRPKLILRKLNK